MKRSRSFFAIVCAMVFIGATTAHAAPKIKFDKTVFKFGSIGQGKKQDVSYTFKNVGDADLNIGEIHTSCGCTNASVTRTKIAPGESAQVKAVFNSGGYRGAVTRTVTVQTNDPTQQSIVLEISGTVKPSVEVYPSSLKFGSLAQGKVWKYTIKVIPMDPSTFQLKSVDSRAKFITFGKITKTGGNKGEWNIPVTINTADSPTGTVFETVIINTNATVQPTVVVSVQGVVTAS